jgi:uncharacterized membrane protein (DUF485 family)
MSTALLKKRTILAITTLATLGAGVGVLLTAPSCFPEWYQLHLRTDFFSASLTMAGFLFTVATFIVTGVKTGIYDTPAYRQRFARLRAIDPSLTLYAPLRGLVQVLVSATAACLGCAVVHVAIGFVGSMWAAAACAACASGTSALVTFAVLAARANFLDWLSHDERVGDANG